MGQVSSKLRRAAGAYEHWCPACEEVHPLPDTWEFDGNLENPTFVPSFLHSGHHFVKGQEASEEFVCHYILTSGIINFGGDCSHSMRGTAVPLPPLPIFLQDT